MLVRNKEINFFSAVENFSLTQDTVIVKTEQNQNPVLETEPILIQNKEKDTTILNPIKQLDFSAIDSILRKSEEREQQIQLQQQQEAARLWYKRKVDTTELMVKQFGIASFPVKEKLETDPFSNNFLYNFWSVRPSERSSSQDVFIENDPALNNVGHLKAETRKDINVRPQYISGKLQFDWITILLILSFLLLGWVRLFNKKYLISLFRSIISYQESNTLYREKNSLMERASFIINLLFVSNISLFSVQLKHYFNVDVGGMDDYKVYLIVFASLLVLYIFRALSSSFIAYVFLKQKVFSEYFHNVNIFTKNTGFVLFPIVVILQFLAYEYLGFIVYIGIILVGTLYLFQILRAFQIIIRKNVSIFYMILYLCAFEFAPFLIVYKLLLSLG